MSIFDSVYTAQLRLLLSTILRAKRGSLVVTFGLVCSSFVSISRGSTGRSFWLPCGNLEAPSVQAGNLLASRRGPECFWASVAYTHTYQIYTYIYISILP